MLRKLLKYELLSSARIFLPLYAALLVLSLVSAVWGHFGDLWIFEYREVAYMLVIFAFYMIMFTLFAVTFVIIIRRFSKNLLGREGYLMFTLPVSIQNHVLSKFLTAVIWQCVTAAVIVISASLIFLTQQDMRDLIIEIASMVSSAFDELYTSIGTQGITALIQLVTLFLIGSFSGIMLIYLAISIGHLVKRHKSLTAVIFYIAVSMFVENFLQVKSFESLNTDNFSAILTGSILIQSAKTIGYFLLTVYILKKKLNLE